MRIIAVADVFMCILFIFVTFAMTWKIVNDNAHSDMQMHFDRNSGASLIPKAWSRLLHSCLRVKIFAFTSSYSIMSPGSWIWNLFWITGLLHVRGWVNILCWKIFNLFDVFFATFRATESIKCRSLRGVTMIRQTRQWSAKLVNLYFGQQQPCRVNNILKTNFFAHLMWALSSMNFGHRFDSFVTL